MAKTVKEAINPKGGFFPGTKITFNKNQKKGVKIKSVKSPKFSEGKYNFK